MALNRPRPLDPIPETGSNVTMMTKEAAQAPKLADFISGRAEDRLTDLLAFALAAEAGDPPNAEAIERHRRRAAGELADHATRTMHNRIEEIRRDAVAEQLHGIRRPMGFIGTVLANVVAMGLVLALGWWLASDPALLARLGTWVGH